jgi:DNA-binding response OmpR family regulator
MPEQPTASIPRPLRVLLIEDSAVILSMLMEYLTAFPFVKPWIGPIRKARRWGWPQPGPIVAIVDLQLRQGNGINVLREMQKARFPGIRIV